MGSEPKLFSLGAFDPEPQIRLIEGLLDSKIGRSGDAFHLAQQSICITPVSLKVISHNLHIDGSWQSEIQNLANHVGGQESERSSRKLFRECQAELVNVAVRWMMFGGQGHKNVRIAGADWRRIAV